MEKSGLWSKRKTADFLFEDLEPDAKKRLIKLNNWITRKRIPKNCMDKIGGEVIFFSDRLKEWIEEIKRKVA